MSIVYVSTSDTHADGINERKRNEKFSVHRLFTRIFSFFEINEHRIVNDFTVRFSKPFAPRPS